MMDIAPAGKGDAYATLCSLLRGETDVLEGVDWTPSEWEAFACLSEKEGVAPLVYSGLRRASWPPAMPEPTRRAFGRSYHANVAHSTLLFSELDRLLTGFTEAGIRVIVLKGAALADLLYADRALRPMNDLDLLVSIDQLETAMDILRRSGYQIQNASYHLVYSGGPVGRVNLELHWSLTGITLPAQAEFFQDVRARAVTWRRPDGSGVQALTLSPEDQLLYLAAHLWLQHPGDNSRLIWYYDLHLLVEQCGNELDWSVIRERRLPRAWTLGLYRTLRGTQERLGTRLPEWWMEALHRQDQVAGSPAEGAGRVEREPLVWVWEALGELGWKLRLRLVLHLLLPHPNYMRWRYHPSPSWLWPVCYPLRWWLLLRDGLVRRKERRSEG